MPDLSRRSFLRFLGVAPVAVKMGILEAAEEIFDPHRVIFDMGRSQIWTPGRLTIDDLNEMTLKYILPKLADEVFRPSPIFQRLRFNSNQEQPWFFSGGEKINVPVVNSIDSVDDE